MKKNRRILSVLLAVLMLAVSAPVAFTATASYEVGDHIQFGTYPQSEVEETEALKAAADAAVWSNAFEYGNSFMYQFVDFLCGGEKYRALRAGENKPQYYIKYEPLTWRILDPNTGFVMCESLIDSQFYDDDSSNDSYRYSLSHIRKWLNYTFYEIAFTSEQKANIQTTALGEGAFLIYSKDYVKPAPVIYDKIFLLSQEDARNAAFGFSTSYNSDVARQATVTDYVTHILNRGNGPSSLNQANCWSLQDFYTDGGAVRCVNGDGSIGNRVTSGFYLNVRPACRLLNLQNDSSPSGILFSCGYASYEHTHSFIGDVTVLGTCAKKGVITYKCFCGESRTGEAPADPNNHASLNENGDCPRCGKHVKDVEKPVPKLNFFQRIIQWFRNLFAKLFGAKY